MRDPVSLIARRRIVHSLASVRHAADPVPRSGGVPREYLMPVLIADAEINRHEPRSVGGRSIRLIDKLITPLLCLEALS